MNPVPSSTWFSAPPHWGWLITMYFFVGGLAGGSYFLSALIDLFGQYADAGCQYVIFRTPNWLDLDPIHLFAGEGIPALATATHS